MSRVDKASITLPKGVEVNLIGGPLTVKGPLGTLTQPIHSLVKVITDSDTTIFVPTDESRRADMLQGMMCVLTVNMVKGMTAGFKRKLNLVGADYRASIQGTVLKLQLGSSHDATHEMPDGVKAETPTRIEIITKGSDKQEVGRAAVEMHGYRPLEPYKGKGVRRTDERMILKETKKKQGRT